MFGDLCKNNKNWCYLLHLDLLFTTLRFVFFAQTTTCTFFGDFCMLLEHMFMSILQKESDFCFYLLIF
jgi:hypothetical protein